MGTHKHSLLLHNLQLSIRLLHSLSLTGGGYKPYFAQGITKGDWKYKKGREKKDCFSPSQEKKDCSSGVSLLPNLGSVCLIKHLSA